MIADGGTGVRQVPRALTPHPGPHSKVTTLRTEASPRGGLGFEVGALHRAGSERTQLQAKPVRSGGQVKLSASEPSVVRATGVFGERGLPAWCGSLPERLQTRLSLSHSTSF